MVGIVVVSHSARLAEGVVELAREMGGGEVAVEAAGGVDEPGSPLGTDAGLIADALRRAGSGDGVVVLMDIGSALLSAETALDLLEGSEEEIVLSAAPLVEGAVAAAAAARTGASVDEVEREARAALAAKTEHLGAPDDGGLGDAAQEGTGNGDALELRATVDNPMGLHARPAARLVEAAARFQAEVTIANATTGRGPVSARSLTSIATLGVRRGHDVVLRARGPQAAEAVAALEGLVEDGFGEGGRSGGGPRPGARREQRAGSPVAASPPPPSGALAGVPASPGIGIGEAHVLGGSAPDVPAEPSGEPDEEWAALGAARAAVRAALASAAEAAPPEARGILEAQALLVDDDALVRPARRAVLEEGRSAARAWSDASSAVVRAYEELDDDYQRARGADVADVCRRVLRALGGGAAGAAAGEGIVVAEEITPADAAAFEPARVQGIAAARGGPTSHGAIVVRARGIPAVVGLGDEVLGVRDGAVVVVDGDRGHVHVNPSEEELAALRARRARAEEAAVGARARAGDEAVTRSGTRVEVTANVGADDAGTARAEGADGIGLLRTELLFLDRRHPPSEDDQAAAYARAADAMEGRPVIVRTLDAGADKPLPFAPRPPEANPFLGVRGLRLALAEPALLGVQLRAVLRAAYGRPLSVMFPMVTTVAELRAARRVLEEAAEDLARRGIDHANSVPVGVMVEVPAVALRAGVFAAEIDFFSLGTNDLTQYTMAAERGNDQVASLGDAVHPAVLALADAVCRAARAHGRWVGVCGEAAGDPAGAALFVGLGVTELSVAPPAIAAVKERVRALDDDDARALARAALECEDAAAVRALVAERSDGGDGAGA